MSDDRLRSYFERRLRITRAGNGGHAVPGGGEAEPPRKRLHLAACVLLLELAHADDEFSVIERDHIEAVLRRHFRLDEATARELMEAAELERQAAGDLYPFAALIRSNYDLGQKTLLAEIMWGLILADGEIARHEAYLLRRIGDLLGLEPGYLAEGRADGS
jgi:uncharacterized tellurite resistance protein B-like protein